MLGGVGGAVSDGRSYPDHRLSGSGKSTLAHATEEVLHPLGCRTYVFDGDNVVHVLCGDLGFSFDDRK